MPIIASTPTIYPETLLVEPEVSSLDDSQWWVLHTKPRAEKSLARKMQELRIPYFLPTHKHTRRQTKSHGGTKGRTLTTEFPLFPSYLFLCGDNDARVDVLKTNLIVHCLPVADQARLHQELRAIHRVMESGKPLKPVEGLSTGTPVKIIRGSFVGLTGKVLNNDDGMHLVIEVTMLGRGAEVDIEPWMVTPLPGE